MALTADEKIKIAMERENSSMAQLSDQLGLSRQNVSAKLSRGNMREQDIREYARALGYEVEITLIHDETKITI